MVNYNEGDQHSETAETNYLQPTDFDNAVVIDHEEAEQPANALVAALTAATLGIPVFPCNPENKRPLINAWQHNATLDTDAIVSYWTAFPDAMVGAVMGKPSGKFVIDIDVKDGVAAKTKLEELEARYGVFKALWMVSTPSGGLHLYCDMPTDRDVRNSAGQLGVGIDIRGTGGYVIFPGSTRFDGKKYRFVTEA